MNKKLTDIERVEKKVESLNELVETQIKSIESFTQVLQKSLEEIKNQADKNNDWLKEFNRLALMEYMGGPKKKVYSFIYEKTTHPHDVRMIMVARDTFEEAHISAKKSLKDSGENVDEEWTMAEYKSLDIPYGSPRVVEKVEEKMPFERPIDVYFNVLYLARDKYATPTQKKVINDLVAKIKKQYANKKR